LNRVSIQYRLSKFPINREGTIRSVPKPGLQYFHRSNRHVLFKLETNMKLHFSIWNGCII